MFKKILSAVAISLITSLSTPAIANVPITSIRFVNSLDSDVALGVFIVPDQDTTRSAYGGTLRRYDVHMAKMFEVANEYCINDWQKVEWHYFAGNGSINMGRFVMSCQLVNDIVTAYGLGQPANTVITYGYGNHAARETISLPQLNLQGGKTDRFVNFTRRFRPQGSAERIDLY